MPSEIMSMTVVHIFNFEKLPHKPFSFTSESMKQN